MADAVAQLVEETRQAARLLRKVACRQMLDHEYGHHTEDDIPFSAERLDELADKWEHDGMIEELAQTLQKFGRSSSPLSYTEQATVMVDEYHWVRRPPKHERDDDEGRSSDLLDKLRYMASNWTDKTGTMCAHELKELLDGKNV